MPRILHTADWRLGRAVPASASADLAAARARRLDVVSQIAAVAHAEGVGLVVVAGDVFDDNQVSGKVLRGAAERLVAFAPIPVLLVAGTSDPAEPGGALSRLGAGVGPLSHVTVATTRGPVDLAGLTVWACPIARRADPDDPTREVPVRGPDDASVQVVVAHGGALGAGGSAEVLSRVDTAALVRRGVDWVALGDGLTHRPIDARSAWPGSPVAGADGGGEVLIVDLARGQDPVVRAVRVDAFVPTEAAASEPVPDGDPLGDLAVPPYLASALDVLKAGDATALDAATWLTGQLVEAAR
jgi:hypothetical protein